MKGAILDVYPIYNKDKMVVWLGSKKGKPIRIEEKYHPFFYVHADKKDLLKIKSFLEELPQIKNVSFTHGKTIFSDKRKKLLLKISVEKLGSIKKIAELVDRWGHFYKYSFFNVDIRLSSRYLNDKNIFCSSYVRWDGKNFFCREKQWDIDYDFPVFKKIFLDINQNEKNKNPSFSFDIPVSSFKINDDICINEENEIDTILSAVQKIDDLDPDIIYTDGGDSFLFPYLIHRAKENNISNLLELGREKDNVVRMGKKPRSYFSYGHIVYRPGFYTLKGRIHIDTSNSFLFKEPDLSGLIDISRCSNIPLQILSRLGPGTAISQIQVNQALNDGFLVPWKKNIPECWKTGMDLLNSDRGGLIFEPKVGLFEDVFELDYASLYPNIMVRYNISPETVLCSCCERSDIRVPQLDYHICSKKEGLLPRVLKPILRRRFYYKACSKNESFDQKKYRCLQKAWKWVLLVCFGYTGYRNARFGRIECHESITAYSRDFLLKAKNIAEKNGYHVLHGIVDSLWVKKNYGKNNEDLFVLARKISNQTGVKMDVEGCYRWIVFLPDKSTGVGALNRYYGLFDNGVLKTRGIELRQKNIPVFLKDTQKKMLDVLSRADNKQEFLKKIPACIDVLKKQALKVIKGRVDLDEMIYTTCVSKDVEEYKVDNLVKSALLQMKDLGLDVKPGQNVCYVVSDEGSRDYKKRVTLSGKINGETMLDVDFYLRKLSECGESILLPFNYSKEKIEVVLKSLKYKH
ncbi:MAG: DNA polymerase domain-containing protein [Candidatus Thermoplasmatota archaeon]